MREQGRAPSSTRKQQVTPGVGNVLKMFPNARPIFSKEAKNQFLSWATSDSKFRTQFDALVVAFILHAIVAGIIAILPESKPKIYGDGERTTVRVINAKPNAATAPQPVTKPQTVTQKPKTKPTVSPKPDFGVQTGPSTVKIPVATPDTPENARQPETPESQTAPLSVSKNLKKLLPGASSNFTEEQRRLGDVIGNGPVGGDIAGGGDKSKVEIDPTTGHTIVKTEYTYAAYFDKLNRRFADAWGGVRTLPPGARFDGIVGEFIEYDVVINRDGSLRKIVNISARNHPHRDFAAVDALVMSVFEVIFPGDPIPDRILQDPLVLRRRIQFSGYKYVMF